MSGPVETTDAPPIPAAADPAAVATTPEVEVSDDHEATVGRFRVRRALPRRHRRTVGAWCFADHMGPATVTETAGLDIGPHPHAGLQTVTWLVEGTVLHRDSLGSEQLIEPGQLNLMTAGAGVAHSEEATGGYRGGLHGVQLWVAQPDATRHGPAAFDHHADLPRADLDGTAVATVLVGELAGARSPARHDTPLVGADLALAGGVATVPMRPGFEYAVVVLTGAVSAYGRRVVPGQLGYLGGGRDELELRCNEPARVLLLGGEPFAEPILMWWNFVARSRAEMAEAYRDWRDGTERFGSVRSALPRIPAPAPYWTSDLG